MNNKLGIGIFVVVVAIVLVAMFAGCVEEHPSAPAVMPTPKAELSLGESAIIDDDISVTVVMFEESEECEFSGLGTTKTRYPKEGARFLWVYVRAENVGDLARKIRRGMVQNINGSTIGAICPKSTAQWTPIARKMYDDDKEIYPNVVEEGWVLFEVPECIEISQIQIRFCQKKGYPCMTWHLCS